MNQPRKKKKGVITAIIILLLLGGGTVGITSCVRNMSQAMGGYSGMALEIVRAEVRDINNSISVSGSVESANIVKVTSKLNAKIQTLNVEVGSQVKQGDVLCVFDSSELQQQYDSLSRNQQNAQGQNDSQHKINERNLRMAEQDKEINLQQAQRAIDDAVQALNDLYDKEARLVDELNQQIDRRDNAKFTMDNTDDPDAYQEAMQTWQEAEGLIQAKEASLDAVRDQFSTYEKAIQSAYDAYDATERSANAGTVQHPEYPDSFELQHWQSVQ